MNWYDNVELGSATIPVIPIGTFDTAKYGKVPLTQAKARRILANFNKRVLKTDVMIDVDHDMSRSAGWVKSLSMGTFPHAVTGAPIKGLLADVEWTPYGEDLVGGKEYRYLSATLGTYHDEETGEDIPDVLYTVSLTNSPVMKLMPSIAMSDAGDASYEFEVTEERTFAFSDFTADTEEPPAPVEDASEEVADAQPIETEEGGTDMADTPETIEQEVETTENDGSVVLDEEAHEAEVELADPIDHELADTTLAERDAALQELAELKAQVKRDHIEAILTKLSAKGLTMPQRDKLAAILSATGTTLKLSDEAEPTEVTDAVAELVEDVLETHVPVEATPIEAPVEDDPNYISPERQKVKELLRT